jgi:hypothetical protein
MSVISRVLAKRRSPYTVIQQTRKTPLKRGFEYSAKLMGPD